MFKLVSKYKPSGDQPEAIKELVDGINNHSKKQNIQHDFQETTLLILSIIDPQESYYELKLALVY